MRVVGTMHKLIPQRDLFISSQEDFVVSIIASSATCRRGGKSVIAYMHFRYRELEFETSLSPFELFERVERHCAHAFILESLGAESEFSRFTYIGAEPYHVLAGEGNALLVNGVARKVKSPYRALKGFLPHVEGLPSHYHGGLVGYVAYDGTKYFEPAFAGEKHPIFPAFEFGLYLDGFLYDKQEKTIRYFTLADDRRDHFHELLAYPFQRGAFSASSAVPDMDKGEYQKAFRAIKEHIRAGNVFQTVFSIGFQYSIVGSPIAVYRQLRDVNPSPHMYCIKFGERYALGASPELLFRTAGRDIEHFGTLAGTVARGATPKEDEHLAARLKADEKEVAEHMMLVDLARNDVGKVSVFGSARAEKLMAVKRYSHVQHLSTEIRGTLKIGFDSFDVLASCAPAGTLTGAPKIEAMKLIAALEKSPRGPYGGSVGYISVNGDAMFAIAIRSLFVAGANAFTRSGSGIVYDSVCEGEYTEIMAKHTAMEEAIRIAAHKHVSSRPASGRTPPRQLNRAATRTMLELAAEGL